MGDEAEVGFLPAVALLRSQPPAPLEDLLPADRVERLRRGLLLLLVVLVAVFILASALIVAPPGAVHLCSRAAPGGAPLECGGPSDAESCAGIGAACVRSSCGHQLAKGLDVSVSGAADPWGPATPTNAFAVLMIAYGLVPYALAVVLVGWLLHAAHTTSLACVGLIVVITALNEGLIKHLFEQHRPMGSCLYFRSFGMPSGHATGSIGMLVYCLLETWVDRPDTPTGRKAAASVALLLSLGPVPYSRVYLHDHYPGQVLAGAVEGAVYAVLWFGFMYTSGGARLGRWVESGAGKGVLRNTYRRAGQTTR
jgi:membrane-associated phospholipid phosphatase